MEKEFDIIIVGGGPAGAAAAITLGLHTSLRIAIIEGSYFDNYRAGESVSPSIFPLLSYLGIPRDVVELTHLQSYGNAAAWGNETLVNRNSIFSAQGNGLLLDRKKFDTHLLTRAKNVGATVFQPARLEGIAFNTDWAVTINVEGTQLSLAAKYLIDCSGKNAVIVKNSGCPVHKEDSLIGQYAYYNYGDDTIVPQQTLIETTENGWYYLSPLPDQKAVIAFITDADILKKLDIKKTDSWLEMGLKTNHIAGVISKLPGPVTFHHYAIHSRVAKLPANENWTAAGDAAASFDPISALGIGHAINSGIHSARVAEAYLRDDHTVAATYSQGVLDHFETYLKMRYGFYSAETRWADSIFWQRRSMQYRLAKKELVKANK